MKVYVLLISLFGLSSLYTALACQENENDKDAENFNQEVDLLDSSFLKSIDAGLKDDESNDVMQSKVPENYMKAIEAGLCTCDRVHSQCTCCAFRQYKFVFWKIPVRACYRLIPLSKHYAAVLTFTLNGHPVYHKIINMTKPPRRVCRRLPKLPGIFTKSDICLLIDKVDAARRTVCARVTGWIKITFKTYHFYANYGCVTLPKMGDSDKQYLDTNPQFDDSKVSRASSNDLEDVKRSDEGENDVDDDIEDVDNLEIPRRGEYTLHGIEMPDDDEIDLDSYLEDAENMRRIDVNDLGDLDDLEMQDKGHVGPGGYIQDADDWEMTREVGSDPDIDDEIGEEDNLGGEGVKDGEKNEDSFFFEEV